MYSSIRISGYRGLDSFRMEGLGRVNLLVGTNNSGKTSILECIELLRAVGNTRVLSAILDRRGELDYTGYRMAGTSTTIERAPVDVTPLFLNRKLHGKVVIEADRADDADAAGWNDRVTMYLGDASDPEFDDAATNDDDDENERCIIRVVWSEPEDDLVITRDGIVRGRRRPRSSGARNGSHHAVQFIGTGGMAAEDVVRMFDSIALTENEEAVIQALHIFDSGIERIATAMRDRHPHHRGAPAGVFLRITGVSGRVPIGSMGDGTWRMLGLALALANARGGVLLVDEIDTGLHYTVMEDMWRMIGEQAAALSVQVFATTHSRDCYESLGAVVESNVGDVTIQRIDRSREKAVSITNQAIVAAAERNVEVR